MHTFLQHARWTFFAITSLCLVSMLVPTHSNLRADDAAQTNTPDRLPTTYEKSTITISKETTVIEGPLREDGYIDYVKALNEHLSKGVTPQNNAAVPLLRAMGRNELRDEYVEQYCRMLGIEVLPAEGDYFVPSNFGLDAGDSEATEERFAEQGRAMEQPWTKEQIPSMAKWLDLNAGPLKLIEEASRRTKYYTPMFTGEEGGPVVAILLPQAQESRSAARLLAARSMLRLGEGDVVGAWADTQTMFRLSRLIGQGGTLIEGLVGIAIDAIALQAANQIADSPSLTKEQTVTILKELQQLKPVTNFADKVDVAERYMFLDSVMLLLRRGPDAGETTGLFGTGTTDSTFAKVLGRLMMLSIDVDEPLRVGNKWYDRIVAALQIENLAERKVAMERYEDDLKQLAQDRSGVAMTLTLLSGTAKERGQLLGDTLISLLLPAISAVDAANNRNLMQRELAEVAYALRLYRFDNSQWPASLDALAPKYLAEVPMDRFSSKPLWYEIEGTEAFFYSVGRNEVDDNGESFDVGKDDLPVRLRGE